MSEQYFYEKVRDKIGFCPDYKDRDYTSGESLSDCSEDDVVCQLNKQLVEQHNNQQNASASCRTLNDVPFSCMTQLVQNYMTCDENIPAAKSKAAYNAFINVTGLKPIDWQNVFNILTGNQSNIANANALFIFLPILGVLLVIIWVMVIAGWIHWMTGIIASIFVFVALYGTSILYRIIMTNQSNSTNEILQKLAQQGQNNFQNSLPYWPQGFFAMACAITAPTGTSGWECNEGESGATGCPCRPCVPTSGNSTSGSSFSSPCSSKISEICVPVDDKRPVSMRKIAPKVFNTSKPAQRRRIIRAKK